MSDHTIQGIWISYDLSYVFITNVNFTFWTHVGPWIYLHANLYINLQVGPRWIQLILNLGFITIESFDTTTPVFITRALTILQPPILGHSLTWEGDVSCHKAAWSFSVALAILCLFWCLPVLHGKNFNIGHTCKYFSEFLWIRAMLVGTIDFYHFMPLSLTFTLAEGCKVSSKPNLLAFDFIFSHTLQLIWMKFGVVKQFKLNILRLLYKEICGIKRNRALLFYWLHQKNFDIHVDIYELICFKVHVMIDTTKHFDASLCNLDFIQGHGCARKQKLLCLLFPKVLNGFGWDLACCLEVLVWWISFLVYFIWPIFKGENPT